MTLERFLELHGAELDAVIRETVGRPNLELDDEEREMWLANVEELYLWAKSHGVPL